MASNEPLYTTYSCPLCGDVDTNEMVQCDSCEFWFHFQCVNVSSDVAFRDWSCKRCSSMASASAEKSSLSTPTAPTSFTNVSTSSRATLTQTRKSAALRRLEEEQSIKLDILNRKYQILESFDDVRGKENIYDNENASTYTSHWASKVQDISNRFSEMSMLDNVSISLSDRERDVINMLSPEELKANVEPTIKKNRNVLKEPMLSSTSQFDRHSQHTQIEVKKPVPTTPANFDFNKFIEIIQRHPEIIFGREFELHAESKRTEIKSQDSPMKNDFNATFLREPKQKTKVTFDLGAKNVSRNRQSAINPELEPEKFDRRSSNVGCEFDRHDSSYHRFAPRQHSSTPMMMKNYRLAHPPSDNSRSSVDQQPLIEHPPTIEYQLPQSSHRSQTTNMNHSEYVSNTSGVLTKNQIAARHVFKELPDFHGRAKDWRIYLSALNNSTTACGYTDSENLGRLQKSLKGPAKDLVYSRLLHAESVPGVVETLHLIFGRPEAAINELLDDIIKTPSPKSDDLAALIKFSISVQNLCSTIEATGQLDYLRNPILLQSLTDKLPTQTQLNWAYHKHGVANVNLSTFGKWLYKLAEVATNVVNPSCLKFDEKKDRKDDQKQPKSTQSISYTNAQSESGSVKKFSSQPDGKCPACDSTSFHNLENCTKFKQLSTEERWIFIKKFRICGGCFGNHHYFKCSSKKKCGKDGCTANHHVLLHNSIKIATTSSTLPATKVEPSTSNSHRSMSTSTKFPDIFRIVPVKLSFNKKSIQIFAYLDDGSNLTSLEESVATKIGASGTTIPLCVLWSLGENRQVESQSQQVSVTISGTFDDADEYPLDHVRTVKNLNLPTQSITRNWLDQYPHFNNIPVATYDNARPQMIIGLQYSNLMVSLETIEGEWSQPIVCRTRLGWVVQGPNDQHISNLSTNYYGLTMCDCQSDDNDLHQLVREFFSIENFGVKITNLIMESKEITRAKFLLETTITRLHNRYESTLLWRNDNVKLPNNYGMALRRLECVESRMEKDSDLAERMRLYIADFVEKGYIRQLSTSEQRKIGPRTWYLPIFPVFNPKKPDKLRVVWDGAAKVNGQSLNSNLLVGPDLLTPLPDILRRFRQRKIGITGDIKEMFHQILVRDSDQDSQRFLWRDGDATRQPDVYVMRVMTFGSSCSPSVAQFVKNKNALEFIDNFPRAVDAITESHYVDDMIDCTHTVEEAIQLVKDVQYVHQHAGFELRSFNSNSQNVLRALHGSDQHGTKILDDKINFTTERVLGLYWNTESDTFTFCLQHVKINLSDGHLPTKREVLSAVMSIFDPLGFLAHFVTKAKILLQDIWRSKIGWDGTLPTQLRIRWHEWLDLLPQVENVHIPCLYSMRMSPVLPQSIQLHVFVDASFEAFCAAAYFRIENESGIDSCLVEAKSRVAPIKPMSVPRLELQGGVLGTRLVASIIDSHRGLHINKTIIWCDSRTVISWIHSDLRRYSQFVMFRVAEILDSHHNIDWRWIPSSANIADEATKSKKIIDLDSSSCWFQGPSFLREQDSNWTFELDAPEFQTDEELRPLYLLSHLEIPVSEFIDYTRFSNWQRLIRTVAYVLRFVNNTRSKIDGREFGVFSSHELLLAESLLYKKVQYDAFQEELVIIRHNETASISEQKDLPQTSVIRTCSAYLDENGVMRMKGRLDAATFISDTAKRPIILDRNHYITKLIVQFHHKKFKHLHHQTVLNELRQKYWIPKLRVVLSVIRNNCQKCKNTAAAPKIPEMAPLPDARLAVKMRPFTYCGIDYFGPIKVVFGRGTAKRWGVLLTCLTTRAVHLEIAHSLDTSSCIMAIYNFIGRRGQPKAFYSDNGTNFHGADNTLQAEFSKLDKDRIQDEFTTSEFSWSFNPPATPHMGGSWERLVQSVKVCLEASMTSRYPTDEVLRNLFIEAENIINSRPLTYVTLDSPNDEILTPNHFLLGSSNGYKPPGTFTDSDLLRNNWRAAQAMADKFWNAFVLDYLPTITRRTKWFKKVEPLKVGNVVLIVDENFKRNTWPKGLVVEVYKDKIGDIRSARVRTDMGTFLTRSVSNLAVLDVHKDSSDVKLCTSDSVNGEEDVVNEA